MRLMRDPLTRMADAEGAGGSSTTSDTKIETTAADTTADPAGSVPDKAGDGQASESTASTDAAGGAAPEGGKDDNGTAEVDPNDTVPEDGVYQFTAPEGMEIDAELAAAVSPVLKELGLTRSQAAKLNDAYAKITAARTQAQVDEWTRTVDGWLTSAKADKELNPTANDAGWDATVAKANRALEKIGTPGLVETLRAAGLGVHPEVIRFAARVGGMIADDSTDDVTGGRGKGADVPIEQRLYGATTPATRT